jgi:hypothetical protein
MIKFISKFWKIGASIVAVITIIQGGSCTWDLLRQKARAAAEAKYQAEMAKKDEAIKAGKQAYNDLSEQAGRKQETIRQSAAKELERAKNVAIALKSESAASLRARDATIAKVLQEKEKDEMLLIEKQETIDYLGTLEYATLWAWKISGDNKDAVHAQLIADLEFKNARCEEVRLKLAKSLRSTFWSRAKEWLKIGAAVGAGYMAGKTL